MRLPCRARPGRGPVGRHHRGPRSRDDQRPAAEGIVPRAWRGPMRHLHAGHAGRRRGAARRAPWSRRKRRAGHDRRRALPLHRVSQDRRRHPGCRQPAAHGSRAHRRQGGRRPRSPPRRHAQDRRRRPVRRGRPSGGGARCAGDPLALPPRRIPARRCRGVGCGASRDRACLHRGRRSGQERVRRDCALRGPAGFRGGGSALQGRGGCARGRGGRGDGRARPRHVSRELGTTAGAQHDRGCARRRCPAPARRSRRQCAHARAGRARRCRCGLGERRRGRRGRCRDRLCRTRLYRAGGGLRRPRRRPDRDHRLHAGALHGSRRCRRDPRHRAGGGAHRADRGRRRIRLQARSLDPALHRRRRLASASPGPHGL